MKFKRFAAFILALVIAFSLSSCKGSEETDEPKEKETTSLAETEEKITSEGSAEDVTEENETEVSAETTTSEEKEDETKDETEKETVLKTENSTDVSEWSEKQIAEFYKKAAKKSDSKVKSEQKILMKDISVNNGQFEGFFDFIMPIMSKLLENNSKGFDGITGGYNNLTENDIASAKAYKSGKNTAVEMVMKKQVSGPNDDALGGSVGHAISAVGDIGAVVKQLTDLGLPLELSDKDTKIYYTNPTVKVLINDNGEIIKGTWKYTVEIRMDNYKAFGKAVENTSVIMDNIVTVNGGF